MSRSYDGYDMDKWLRERRQQRQSRYNYPLPPIRPKSDREIYERQRSRVVNDFGRAYGNLWERNTPNGIRAIFKPKVFPYNYTHYKVKYVEYSYKNDTIHAIDSGDGHKGCILCEKPSTHYAVLEHNEKTKDMNLCKHLKHVPCVALCTVCGEMVHSGSHYGVYRKNYDGENNTYE